MGKFTSKNNLRSCNKITWSSCVSSSDHLRPNFNHQILNVAVLKARLLGTDIGGTSTLERHPMNAIETLNTIFQRVFDDDGICIRPEMTADDIDGWDSLSHVNLITTVETKFNVRFTQKELLRMKNIGNLLRTIETKIADRS